MGYVIWTYAGDNSKSDEFRTRSFVSSLMSRLGMLVHCVCKEEAHILNLHEAAEGELFEVGLHGDIVVGRADVRREPVLGLFPFGGRHSSSRDGGGG